MLLSLEKNFIFIHVPKTAGTSIVSALMPWCQNPQRTQWRRLLSHLPVPEAPEKALLREHNKAAWLRRKIPGHLYDGAYKFAVVRNPYALAVSTYYQRRDYLSRRRWHRSGVADFSTFLHYLERKNRLARVDQTSWVSDRHGNLIIDEVLRFETLADEFKALVERLGLPGEVRLPRANVNAPYDYRAVYDDETKSMVRRLYARDFDRFGYAF
ncbi:MAG: sulfotransferase family protein [Mesorhizobium sp.]|uniref:sulfotransferase family 2 domain-containing protein n=1 Tax=Mesorhizobium sp. TaxID=1871066 RepID=UPI001201F597|nr:sulfotransferase family 2 domain-containing protein [Mesorhizobium sp.]TIS53042.1 MAG: sulfotransferase family protein [Mesorhizobium sp.]TIS85454.1 MAG: sulfotransferase family protein [Mesorhizobium sp.]TJW02465.1 MAG: sulfotransferase family protein [Mesorhizobium sp.]TJW41928.1 MAG: sulfotransferase family protein [Mesorhizobium sp.]